MTDNRFDRQILLFGEAGQQRLRAARVAVVGAGGTGSVVIPQLALLGVGSIAIVEPEELDQTNRNRHLCARSADPIPGTLKTDIARRMVHEYDPTIHVDVIPESVLTSAGFAAVKSADFVFGCVDLEGIRLVLLELCAAYAMPYFDVATGVEPGSPPQYGGRVCCAVGGNGCSACLGELDLVEAARDLETIDQRQDRAAIYGIDQVALGRRGPSVVSINAITASLAVTEFLKLCTGLDAPTKLLRYDGRTSRVIVRASDPVPDCYFCKAVWGAGAAADVERYLTMSGASV